VHRLWAATLGLWRPEPYETIWLENTHLHKRLAILARTTHYDVIHVDTLGLLPYAGHFPRAATVLTHHDIQSLLFARRAAQEGRTLRGWYSRFETRKLERAERELAPRVDLNVTVSALDAERLAQIAGDARTTVVPNGVDVDYFRPMSGDESAGLVFAASFDTIPNQDAVRFFLGEIWPLLVSDDPRRRMAFVGRGPGADLRRAAADRRVHVTGPVADVRPFIAAATIYVCPLRVGGGTRLKVLDALAMGKALVATKLSVEGLSLAPEVHYLEAETPLDFLRQIRRLELDPHLRHRLGRAGRELVEQRYAWQVIGMELDRAYREASATRVASGR
jgi:glycosyltransferase involved in cell wall biosynthesis